MTRVYVAGHRGLVGSAICRRLEADGVEPLTAGRAELDLTDAESVDTWPIDRVVSGKYARGGRIFLPVGLHVDHVIDVGSDA